MPSTLKLTCIFAHPDDEAMGMGGTLAKYAAEGIQIHLITATRGERGWAGSPDKNPGLQGLGQIREAELRCAAARLGIHEVVFLDYIDGDLDQADSDEAVARIVTHLRRIRPHVVVTFGPEGAYGHPDHIAISQFTNAAVVCAADSAYSDVSHQAAHRVDKLYYMVDSWPLVEFVKEHLGGIQFEVDGIQREHTGWPDWAISTHIESYAYWQTAVEAIACHQTQLTGMPGLLDMHFEEHQFVWCNGNFYRAFSLVNNGHRRESDLFEGLR